MKKISIIGLSVLMLTMGSSTYAINEKEIEYHCPSLNEFKFDRGRFNVETSYHGVKILWAAIGYVYAKDAQVKEFHFTTKTNNCHDGTCQVYCVYTLAPFGEILRLFVFHQEYRLAHEMKGPWIDKICASKNPEDCTFTVIKNH